MKAIITYLDEQDVETIGIADLYEEEYKQLELELAGRLPFIKEIQLEDGTIITSDRIITLSRTAYFEV